MTPEFGAPARLVGDLVDAAERHRADMLPQLGLVHRGGVKSRDELLTTVTIDEGAIAAQRRPSAALARQQTEDGCFGLPLHGRGARARTRVSARAHLVAHVPH